MTSALWLCARRAALIDPSASEDELAHLTERLTPALARYGAFIVESALRVDAASETAVAS